MKTELMLIQQVAAGRFINEIGEDIERLNLIFKNIPKGFCLYATWIQDGVFHSKEKHYFWENLSCPLLTPGEVESGGYKGEYIPQEKGCFNPIFDKALMQSDKKQPYFSTN